MATDNFTNFKDGIEIVPKSTSTVSSKGDFDVTSADGKVNYHNGTTSSPLVTEAHASTLTNKTIDADSNTITNIENADIKSGAAIDAAKIANGSVSSTEYQYLDGVTSSIQTQLNTISGSAVTALTGDVSATGPGSVAATVNTVGGSSAANVHSAELLANAATNTNTASTIVKRDGSGNFTAGTITATLTGNASNVSGTVAIANGGSGQTTANTALNAFLPSQTSNSGKILGTDGTNTSWVAQTATGANTALSNLISTAINQNLVPDSDAARTVGSAADRWSNMFTAGLEVVDSSRIGMRLLGSGTIPSGETSAQIQGWDVSGVSQPVAITSLNNGTNNSTATANTFVETGNKTAGTGNSGNIILQTGTSAGGARGAIVANSTGLTLNEITTPANPASTFDKIYPKSDHLFYSLDSSGNEKIVGNTQTILSLTESSTPSSPSSGTLKFYAKTDDNLYIKNSSGVESILAASTPIRSEVWVQTGNGMGSTNNVIRRFSTICKNVGTAITYADSSTLGSSFTINEDGLYSISYADAATASGDFMGISLNSTHLTTTINGLSQPENQGSTAMFPNNQAYATLIAFTAKYTAGDVIRPHTDGSPNGTQINVNFRIIKVNN